MSDRHRRGCRKRWVLPFAGEMGPDDCPTCRALRLKEERPDHAFADEPVELLELMYAPKMATPRPAAESEYEDFRDKPSHEFVEDLLERILDDARRRDPLAEHAGTPGPTPRGSFLRAGQDALRRYALARRTLDEVDDLEWHLKAAWRAGYDYVDVLMPFGDRGGAGVTVDHDIRALDEGDEPTYASDPSMKVRRFDLRGLEPEDIPTLHDKTNTGADASDTPQDRGASGRGDWLFGEDRAGGGFTISFDTAQSPEEIIEEIQETIDRVSGESPPEALGECVECGRAVEHDEAAVGAEFRFNGHGEWHGDRDREDGLYHHRCLRKRLRQGRPSPAQEALRDILERAREALERTETQE